MMKIERKLLDNEIAILQSALNEALELLEDPEFAIRMGCERWEAEELLKKLQTV